MKRDDLIVVRGGGDLATGVVHRLWSAGLRVLVLETAHPAAIRRQVSLCEAVYEGETAVEGMRGIRVETLADADAVWAQNAVPVLIDPTGACLPQARPAVLVDAIIAKKNLGTTREMASLTIALGPGFAAGQDVDVVVETKRGHRLGRVIEQGPAAPNSGLPGNIMGYTGERIIRSTVSGRFEPLCAIGDLVEAGQTVARVNGEELKASEGSSLQLWMPETVARYFTRNIASIELTREDAVPEVASVDPMYRNKIEIKNSADGCAFEAGDEITFEGVADDCGSPIAAIEFSFDNGRTWTSCDTDGATADKWVNWQFTTSFEEKGDYRMTVRAKTADGMVSPLAATLLFEVA